LNSADIRDIVSLTGYRAYQFRDELDKSVDLRGISLMRSHCVTSVQPRQLRPNSDRFVCKR
jgi:hypothetical protein